MVSSTDLGEEGGLPAADHHRIRLENPQDLVLLVLVLVEQAHDLLTLCRGLPRENQETLDNIILEDLCFGTFH